MRPDQQGLHAPEQDRAGEGCGLLGAQAFANQRKGLLGNPVARAQIVGAIEVDRIDGVAPDEGHDRQRFVAFGNGRRNLVGLEHDVFVLPDLVALHLRIGLDRLAGLLVDELPAYPMSRGAIERMEGDPLGGRRSRVKGNRACQLGDLQEAFPVRPRRHRRHSNSPRLTRCDNSRSETPGQRRERLIRSGVIFGGFRESWVFLLDQAEAQRPELLQHDRE